MDYYTEIKKQLINNEVYKKVKDYSKNRNDLSTYYNVGKLIVEAQGGEKRAKYGDGLIKEYSNKLTLELGKGYTITSLKYMRQSYLFLEKGHTMCDQLSWSHYKQLLFMDDYNKIEYYIKISINYRLSVRELITKIKNKEYERLPESTKNKLVVNEKIKVQDLIKNPIIINNNSNYNEISEKVLKQLIIEDIDDFLNELGDGFSYIGNEYKIKLGNRYNYIDLMLFNIKYNCYVVVELKITELQKEYIGQIQTYMNYIDRNIRKINHDKTIGIIICKKDNKFIMEYCSDERIFSKEYVIN